MPAAPSHRKSTKSNDNAPTSGRMRWITGRSVWVPTLTIGLVGLMGCAVEPVDSEVLARVHTTSAPSIFGGAVDDDGQAVAGVVALRVGTGTTFELCSGALLAPNLVLTARHCVIKTVSTSVSCDENGRSANGPHVASDESPANIGVYVGANPSFAKAPTSTGRAVVAPSGQYLCDSDIALVVLATPITTVTPLSIRIHSPARAGERIRSVGYGQNDKASPIGTRFRREGVEVLAQGKAVSKSKTPLGRHEFEVGTSICQGDSGGPAISEDTGAVLGVVSRGGGCNDDFGHIYTTTAGFDTMFADAFELAGATPAIEDGPLPTRTNVHAAPPVSEEEPTSTNASATSCALTSRTSAPQGGVLAALAGVLLAFGVRRARRGV